MDAVTTDAGDGRQHTGNVVGISNAHIFTLFTLGKRQTKKVRSKNGGSGGSRSGITDRPRSCQVNAKRSSDPQFNLWGQLNDVIGHDSPMVR